MSAFAKKPHNEKQLNNVSENLADKWVENRKISNSKEVSKKIKRLTLDIPADLHAKIKIYCVNNQVTMIDEILPLLKMHFSSNDEK